MYRMFNSVLTFVPLSSLLANDAGERLSVDFHVVQMCILERYIASIVGNTPKLVKNEILD